ncbi:uncharacterized protein AAGF69_006858 [Amazona ochrocephala]
MVEAAGPTRLLEVCGQLLSRFLRDAERKRLAWLREVEEQGMRMLESNLVAEPGPMARTPSQRRRSRKRQSSCLKDYSREPSRRRLSRRRSSIKLVSFKPGSQRRQSKEQPLDAGCAGEGAQACAAAALPALPGEGAAEAPGPSRAQAGAGELPIWEQSPQGDAASEWQDEAPVTGVFAGPTARGAQAAPGRRTSTSTPKAAGAAAPAALQGAGAAPDLGELPLPGSHRRAAAPGPAARRCSRRRSSPSAPPAGGAKRRSLASGRASRSRRAVARRAAAPEPSSASSRASCEFPSAALGLRGREEPLEPLPCSLPLAACASRLWRLLPIPGAIPGASSAARAALGQSSLEVFVEEDVAGMRPGLEVDPASEGAPEDTLPASRSTQAAGFPAQHSCAPELQAGSDGVVLTAGSSTGTPVNPDSESQNKDQEQSPCARPQEDPPCIRADWAPWPMPAAGSEQAEGSVRHRANAAARVGMQWSLNVPLANATRTRSPKQAMGAVRKGQQPGAPAPSPWADQHGSPAEPSSGAGSKVPRPLRSLLRAVQRHPGPPRHGTVLRSLIQRSTPPRPSPKGDFVVSNDTLNRGHWRTLWASRALTAPSLSLAWCSCGHTRGEVQGLLQLNQHCCQTCLVSPLLFTSHPGVWEKERQRLESLRKKQEAEEQRKKKMEEEKRRRQAEMKQKREERLRKALQARERAEEEKKKRMEQKILQSDEKVRLSQVRDREEKAEERGRKKLSKKSGEADARKQKALKREEHELEQQEPLQKRRGDEVRGKGKKVLELKSLLEQQQAGHGKERAHRHGGKEKPPHPQLGAAAVPEQHRKQEEAALQRPADKKLKQAEAPGAAPGTGLSATLKKSISAPYLKPLKGTKQSSQPKVSEDNYGMDQNSDDATDDENDPRKPVPAWADGPRLRQGIVQQYYHPVNTDQLFGLISGLRLEEIFGKSKPRYFKRTSSAVWHSPPRPRSASGPSCSLNK